jgi:hypothetical protein
MMNPAEISLARRIIDLRGTCFKARGNKLVVRKDEDRNTMAHMLSERWTFKTNEGHYVLTSLGIQQLKLQIGEFTFRS